ncbi:3,4-dihydroxy-2-butanone-4-phosphate synthase [Shinella daejeonensis]|uniref:3,4-dihydroxy-2-butanone-4-phosphate synthase n=1 Tax=Shinella daejeonensis TaxID=659017 RepID=UPI0020C7607B|nr:3,4-dihydroxy-2-butanone-4-phosphate synthase [Shinella daejeonensis]MCP8894564.1 3,4-dihydroxy-2-butanone-4-phosphate synthase [Shinella daejeonensis]
MAFATIEAAIEAIRAGRMVVVVDDEDRENEGDLVIASDLVTPEAIAFMMRNARGLVCVSIDAERARELRIPLMVAENTESLRTAFTVSIDIKQGATTGISAQDRALTVKALFDPSSRPDDFARPGHVFPLIANPGGVLARPGHTEASADLARLAGLNASGVICEIANDDGTMSRLPQLLEFSRCHDLLIVTIKDLIAYRRRLEKDVEKVAACSMPLRQGLFDAIVYRDRRNDADHVALVMRSSRDCRPLVRVHSECLTGEAFGSLRCDCGEQLQEAIDAIADRGHGCLIYMRGQEGRGIGLADKIRAYALQSKGFDTFAANRALDLPDDTRSYTAAADILKDLGFDSIDLITDNPGKVATLEQCGIEVVSRQGSMIASNASNIAYFKAKAERYGGSVNIADLVDRITA